MRAVRLWQRVVASSRLLLATTRCRLTLPRSLCQPPYPYDPDSVSVAPTCHRPSTRIHLSSRVGSLLISWRARSGSSWMRRPCANDSVPNGSARGRSSMTTPSPTTDSSTTSWAIARSGSPRADSPSAGWAIRANTIPATRRFATDSSPPWMPCVTWLVVEVEISHRVAGPCATSIGSRREPSG